MFEVSPVTFHVAFAHLCSGALRIAKAGSDLFALFGAHIARMSMVACLCKRSCLLESQPKFQRFQASIPALVTEARAFIQGLGFWRCRVRVGFTRERSRYSYRPVLWFSDARLG